ncbi:MAG: NAD(P)-dependent glycerol-3-phosphate dehydrogenase [Deltaproteobacteria bacterium]|nr:NAD(P)-dependent glycerol-3-phosphate dehydrogenase [Deltaproteobacteria bacterium]
MSTADKKIAVIGAGSWGTTLAALLGNKGYSVSLWVREAELADAIDSERENTFFLPGVRLPDTLSAERSLAEALKGAELVLCSVPSHGIRGVFKEAAEFIEKDALIVNVSKGIEEGTRLTSCAILRDVLPPYLHDNVVALSGPTFAKEVSRDLPAAVCVAAHKSENAATVQEYFSTPTFRVYTNTDPIGVELGGILKNVIALASGISDGLALGANARAALITRGLHEIARLGVALGAKESTFYGLSGMGDLVLTCTDALSRNYTVGTRIGKGEKLNDIIASMKMVAEGVKTSRPLLDIARENNIEMPIVEEVCAILYEGKTPATAVKELMGRELKDEANGL